jgi:hypothetical protein
MKRFTLILLSILISTSIFAQGRGNRMEVEKRYRSQKIAFITDKMQLTPVEAQEFWPLYNKLEAEKDVLAQEMHEYRAKYPEDEADMTEEQALEFLAFFNKHTSAMFKLHQDYQKQYLKVISAKKLLLLNNAENGFRRHLLQEFRGKGANRR